MSEVKGDRRYTDDHEWAREVGDEIVVGISAFAVSQLGDITLVSLDVAPGDTVEAKQRFGTIESVKTLSDLFAPVSGSITRINSDLDARPELVNDDCWEAAWMVAIRPSSREADWQRLLDAEAYREYLEKVDH
jgi:glycine cleavage system H protein